MESNRVMHQKDLLESVLEVLTILKERRPDLENLITILTNAEVLLRKDNLSDTDLAWIDEKIIHYVCHPKCLYDFCPLVQLEGETGQMRWQRWGQIVDQMLKRAVLLCKRIEKKKRNAPTLKNSLR